MLRGLILVLSVLSIAFASSLFVVTDPNKESLSVTNVILIQNDENGTFTDQTVAKVENPDGLNWFYSEDVSQGGYFADSPVLPFFINACDQNCTDDSFVSYLLALNAADYATDVSMFPDNDFVAGVYGFVPDTGKMYVAHLDEDYGNWTVSVIQRSGSTDLFGFVGGGTYRQSFFDAELRTFVLVFDAAPGSSVTQFVVRVEVDTHRVANFTFNGQNTVTIEDVIMEDSEHLQMVISHVSNSTNGTSSGYVVPAVLNDNGFTVDIAQDPTPLPFPSVGHIDFVMDYSDRTIYFSYISQYGNYEIYIGNPYLNVGVTIPLLSYPRYLALVDSTAVIAERFRA